MPVPVLEINALTKRFGDVRAVENLTESIGAGEYFCILGPSGCGKTTLLRLIAGFEEPTSGTLSLSGKSLLGVPPEKRDVNIVFQSYALFPHMSVFENVAFGLRARRTDSATVNARVSDALQLVRLNQESDRLPRQLSGGQQQRVALARALVMQPRLLLLDEPLSALDRHLRLAMQEELRRIHNETGLTFVHITHDQSEALALGNRVAVMRKGKFLQVATPMELYRRPATRFIAEFVGSSNVLDGATLPPELRSNSSHAVSIRPEAIQLSTSGIDARIAAVAFAGATIELLLDVAGQRWVAHIPSRGSHAELRAGADVHVTVDPADITVLDDDA